jgi:hypothetical protein
MNNIIYVDFVGHVASDSDAVAFVECVKATILSFGEVEFALSLVENFNRSQEPVRIAA